MALPPAIELALQHLTTTKWEEKPRAVKGKVTVRGAKSTFSSFDTLKVDTVIEGIAPSTLAAVYAWNRRDMADMASPMNAIDDMRVSIAHYGKAADPDAAALAQLIEARGDAKWAADRTTMAWTAAAGLPAPHPDEELWHMKGRSPMPLVKARDFVLRKQPPTLLSADQAAAWGLRPGAWVTAALPSDRVPKAAGLERGVMFRWGIVCEPADDASTATRLTIATAFDMCGSVPAMMANLAVSKSAEMVIRAEEQGRRIKAANGGRDTTPEEFLAKP